MTADTAGPAAGSTPATRRRRAPERRRAILAAALTALLGLAASGPAPSSAAIGGPGGGAVASAAHDKALDRSMVAIARAFRTGKADSLATILHAQGKVFVSLRSVGDESGYYGPDQVYFIFRRIFSQLRTVRFDIRHQKGGTAQGHANRSGLTYCVGNWSYRRQGGLEGACRIHFVLSSIEGRWFLVQIREAR